MDPRAARRAATPIELGAHRPQVHPGRDCTIAPASTRGPDHAGAATAEAAQPVERGRRRAAASRVLSPARVAAIAGVLVFGLLLAVVVVATASRQPPPPAPVASEER
jgi:hypothetical protein